ncbi:MAG: MMPL family transporter, partial [Halobacteria archaeon]|nr:MMPL family transporter [Halobacteria archaeon]
YLLGIPFNVITGTITSLTVGLGIAYTIHMSERYRLELERRSSVWDAMETATRGTGGALLGSAATTIGGFGVLVFAIIPILQQFGIITGLSILYAFLASVVVLPSMLVIWTRYLGPEEASQELKSKGSREPAPPVTGEIEEAEVPDVTRSMDRRYVGQGDDVNVTIALEGVHGRTVLREDIRGVQNLRIDSVSPEPIAQTHSNGTLYVVWEFDDPADAELHYTVFAPDTIEDDHGIAFDGEVRSDSESVPTEGSRLVVVTQDVFKRINNLEEVSDDEIELAYEAFERGSITTEELETIHSRWLDGHPEDEESEGGTEGEETQEGGE